MAKYVYVDNSNVFIEGQRVAAVQNGLALDIQDAITRRVFDHSYRLDFGKLYRFVARNGDADAERAVLFGSRPPPNDSLWAVAKSAGFELVIEDRNAANKEKKIDTGIVAAMYEDAFTKTDKEKDKLVLVAGDGDYLPAISRLIELGFTVDVLFWAHASQALKTACSNFIEMDSYFADLAVESD